MKVFLNTLNSAFKQIGADETLVKGKGYFYFIGENQQNGINNPCMFYPSKNYPLTNGLPNNKTARFPNEH